MIATRKKRYPYARPAPLSAPECELDRVQDEFREKRHRLLIAAAVFGMSVVTGLLIGCVLLAMNR